jgi:hypothetical protein
MNRTQQWLDNGIDSLVPNEQQILAVRSLLGSPANAWSLPPAFRQRLGERLEKLLVERDRLLKSALSVLDEE